MIEADANKAVKPTLHKPKLIRQLKFCMISAWSHIILINYTNIILMSNIFKTIFFEYTWSSFLFEKKETFRQIFLYKYRIDTNTNNFIFFMMLMILLKDRVHIESIL